MTRAPANRALILVLFGLGSFAIVFNNLIISPLMPAIRSDFGVSTSLTGLLVTAYALTGGVAALFAGPLIDRFGRRSMIVLGMAILAGATMLSAAAPGFAWLMAARALAGLGIACLAPAIFSGLGDYFAYQERARAMAWVVTANQLASVVGVPAGVLAGAAFGWRWTFVTLAVVTAGLTVVQRLKLPRDEPRAGPQSPGLGGIAAVLRERQIVGSIGSVFCATTGWFCFFTYLAAFYHDDFGVSKAALSGLTMVSGLGLLTGSVFGGRLADRIGKQPIVLATGFICAATIVGASFAPHVLVSLAFVLVFTTAWGGRFTSMQALVSEMAPERRGTVMALFSSWQQFGIVAGSALGAYVLRAGGYQALGPTSAALVLVSNLLVWRFADEARLDRARALAEA